MSESPKPFRKVYLEITNVCNLRCSFCPGTKRAPRFMERDAFCAYLTEIKPYTDFVYFHLMGEPLLHPDLPEFVRLAGEAGLKVCLTTNGSLLRKRLPEILPVMPYLHKVNLSLQAGEGNPGLPFDAYLADCIEAGRELAARRPEAERDPAEKTVIVFRLWNEGGADRNNGRIEEELHRAFPGDWTENSRGWRLADRVFLEYAKTFEWPDLEADYQAAPEDRSFCYGLKDQFGIQVDGTVVPCCLDHEGNIALGKLGEQELPEILEGSRARALAEGFQKGVAAEELCRRCGYSRRFC